MNFFHQHVEIYFNFNAFFLLSIAETSPWLVAKVKELVWNLARLHMSFNRSFATEINLIKYTFHVRNIVIFIHLHFQVCTYPFYCFETRKTNASIHWFTNFLYNIGFFYTILTVFNLIASKRKPNQDVPFDHIDLSSRHYF